MRKRVLLALLMLLSVHLASISASGLSINDGKDILAAHNRYRAEVNATPLKWSENLSAQAQQCADYNAANFLPLGQQKHCRTPGFGQNIAMSTSNLHLKLTQMADAWSNEKRNFLNGEYPSVSATGSPDAVSHYTQMIWQNTSEVGCGEANASGYDILVCDYSPQGNINGTVVYSPKQPQVVAVNYSNLYKSFRTDYSGMPIRNVLINTVFNRPVLLSVPSVIKKRNGREMAVIQRSKGDWKSGIGKGRTGYTRRGSA